MKLKKQFRSLSVSDVKVDEEKRSARISFSSEYPVERWYGTEILSHEKGAADFTRINSGAAPLLFNHNPDNLIGDTSNADIAADKRAHVDVYFSKSPMGEEKYMQFKEGVLKNVSFGYMVKKMDQIPANDGKPMTFVARDWEVYEISFVSVPADPTVGYGRADSDLEVDVEIKTIGEKREKKMEKEIVKETPVVDVKVAQSEAVAGERARSTAISALGDKYKMKDLARQLIEGGKSVLEAREIFCEKVEGKQVPIDTSASDLGMNEREIKDFSIVRMMNAAANPTDRAAQESAKYEREICDAAALKANRTPQGFLVPSDVLKHSMKRDLSVGTSTAGGNLVATDLLSGSFIELLRNKIVVQQLGATMLTGLQGQVAIPRLTGGATAYWVGEAVAVTASNQTVDQVTLSPKTVGAKTVYSRKLLLQSSISVENLVRNDIAKVLAIEIDRAALYGSGSSSQPTGIKNISGISTSDFAANTPTFLEMIGLETLVAAANADIGSLAYLTNATGRGALKGTQKATNQAMFVWDGNTVNGYKAEVSNQVAANDFWFANWADLLIGMWSGLDILVDPYTGSSSGNVQIVALQDLDIAVRHPLSFARGNNTL